MSTSGITIDSSYITPQGILAAAIVPTVLASIAVILRFTVRIKHQKAALWWDDWLLVPGLLLTVGMMIAMIVGVAGHGLGYTKGLPEGSPPIAQLSYLAPNVILTEQVEYAVQLMQPLALGFIKASFIMFYRRIFCQGNRSWFWYATWVTLVLTVCWTITFFFVFLFYCGTNIWAEWNTVLNLVKYCPNGAPFQVGLAISDFLMDLLVIVLPIPAVIKLQISLKRKLLIVLVFLLGLVALAASITRMAIFVIQMTINIDLSEDGDKIIGLILFWSIIENGAAIIAACLPTLRFLIRKETLEGMIRSLRSKMSLHSLRTKQHDDNSSEQLDRGTDGPELVFGGRKSAEKNIPHQEMEV